MIRRIGLGGNRAAGIFWKVFPREIKSDAARVGLDDDNLERMNKNNIHGNKYVLDYHHPNTP